MNTCSQCGGTPIEAFGLCASCNSQRRKLERESSKPVKPLKPIRKTSEKKQRELLNYSREKVKFLKGKICPVYPEEPVTDIHHRLGRIGFADTWARERGVTLTMDKRYWLAVSRKGHDCIETHPSLARARGWSLPRTEIIQEPNPTI